jgi:hypothetical protein
MAQFEPKSLAQITPKSLAQIEPKSPKEKKWEKPAYKSKSVAALPCNPPFTATHMLFLANPPALCKDYFSILTGNRTQ